MPKKHRYAPLTSAQHVTRPDKRKEENRRTCPVCGAKRGQTCFVLTGTKFIELRTTHITQAKRQFKAQNRPSTSARVPMALDKTLDTPPRVVDSARKTSTEKLDREYAEKKARIAAGERRRNGG